MNHEKLYQWTKAQHGRGMQLALALGVTQPFIGKVVNGQKPVPVAHAATIERLTQGAVTRKDMFPEDWQRIWPELAAAGDRAASDQSPQPTQGTAA